MHTCSKLYRTAMALLAVIVLFSLLPPSIHAEAAGGDKNIRVSLFIAQRGTVPAVTLHASGFNISEAAADGTSAIWQQLSGSRSIRASLNQYKVKVLETGDSGQAISMKNQLSSQGEHAYVIERPSAEGARYIVYAAPSASKQAAEQARARIQNYGFAGSASVSGPYYWNAGTYSSEAAAWDRIRELPASAGEAVVALSRGKQGEVQYSAWIGAAADPSELSGAKAAAAGGEEANRNVSYVLKMKELIDRGQSIDRFEADHKRPIIITPESGYITVAERHGRTYRGAIEINSYADQLAVINELPLEQYLYGVVGAEMGTGWPQEALKAQAVAARSFALSQQANGIAHISDTTYDQAYHGVAAEAADVIQAVDATKGEVLRDSEGRIIAAFYFSNAGGMTAAASEIWGEDVPYLRPMPSPDDGPEQGKLIWERVVLADGSVGYVRSDFVDETGQATSGGLPILSVNGTNVNVRKAPYVDNVNNPPITQVNNGDRLIRIGQSMESTAYRWIRGPFSGTELAAIISGSLNEAIRGTLTELKVTERGPSGRVTAMEANGQPIEVSNPDRYRTVLGSLPSTRFDVEQNGNFEVMSSRGKKRTVKGSGSGLHAVSGSGSVSKVKDEMLAVNNNQQVRYLTAYPQFRFIGYGNGHGLGMSQWGARGLAEFMGYDYKEILLYYYDNVTLSKE